MSLQRNGFQRWGTFVCSLGGILGGFDVRSIKPTVLLPNSVAQVSEGRKTHRSADTQLLIRDPCGGSISPQYNKLVLYAVDPSRRVCNHVKIHQFLQRVIKRVKSFFSKAWLMLGFSMRHTSRINRLGQGCGNISGEERMFLCLPFSVIRQTPVGRGSRESDVF